MEPALLVTAAKVSKPRPAAMLTSSFGSNTKLRNLSDKYNQNTYQSIHAHHCSGPYRILSIASHASDPPSKLHPSGPKSHSAQIRYLTCFSAFTGAEASGRVNPMLSKAKGQSFTRQKVPSVVEVGAGKGEAGS